MRRTYNASRVISRRCLLLSLPALMAAPRLIAQVAQSSLPPKGVPPGPVRARGINHVTLSVRDVKRSVDFYQGLFGMPVISPQQSTVNLQIGAGPQFLGVSDAGSEPPRIDHLCLGVDDFHEEQRRVEDPNGFVIHLQDARSCGEGHLPGNACAALEPAPRRGLLAVRGWSHCTNTVPDPALSRSFWQKWVGLRVQAYQGPAAPVFGIPGTVEFLMFSAGPQPAINHVCMTMENFRPDVVIKALESYGIKPRGDTQGTPGPLVHYISVRREDRGGSKEGTLELYFTDPDGLRIQLQDVSYCGGSGALGDVCL
jgi:catechol 2,3-dioxygenase-like lactoylglutathione lyase family enzyme